MSDGQYFRQGRCSQLNIAAAAQVSTVPKDFTLANARLVKVSVTTAGAAGAIYDTAAGAAGAIAGNLVCVIPAAIGVFLIDWPITAGIYVVPGAAQVCGVSYD